MGYGITSKTTKNARKVAKKTALKNGKVTVVAKAVKASVKTSAKPVVKKTVTPRAVTFEIKMVNNRRTFRPVNKRAKALAEFSNAKVLTAKHIKALKALKFRVLETVTLAEIKV